MANYIGDFALGDTFDTKFCTVTTTGAPTTLAGTPVISAYVGNSLTEITAGITLTVDFDSRTGLNNVRVVATSGNGYATASNYQLVITTGTVGGTSVVGYVVAEFSIEARSALRPTTAARTLDVSATGEAGVDWANVGSPTTANTLSSTTVGTVTTVTGLTASNLDAAISTIATPAQVKTQVVAALNTDTYAEPAQGAPTATTTLVNKIGHLYKYLRNRVTVTATTISVFNDDAVTVDHKSTHSDDGTTYDRGEFASGP